MKISKLVVALLAVTAASASFAAEEGVSAEAVIAPLTNISTVTTTVTQALNPEGEEFAFTEGSNVALIGQSTNDNIAYIVQDGGINNFAAIMQGNDEKAGVAYINQAGGNNNRAIISQK